MEKVTNEAISGRYYDQVVDISEEALKINCPAKIMIADKMIRDIMNGFSARIFRRILAI